MRKYLCLLFVAATLLGQVRPVPVDEFDRLLRVGVGGHTLRAVEPTSVQDEDALGTRHSRYQYVIKGVPVFGMEGTVHEKRDGARRAFLPPVGNLDVLEIAFKVEDADAIATACRLFGATTPIKRQSHERVIYPITRMVQTIPTNPTRHRSLAPNADQFTTMIDSLRSAHMVCLEEDAPSGPRGMAYVLDSTSGEVLASWSTVYTVDAQGTGKSQYFGTVPITTTLNTSGKYELRDNSRSGARVYDLGNSEWTYGTIYTSAVNEWGDGTAYLPVSPTTSANGQTPAVDVYVAHAITWDFLKTVLGRNGVLGTGASVTLRVHYGSAYDNAMWSGDTGTFGDGTGIRFKNLTDLDVVSHELAHGVSGSTARFINGGESGGMGEANSDIFAIMVGYWHGNGVATATAVPSAGGDWLVGERVTVSGSPIRFMDKPSLDGKSPDAWYPELKNLNTHYSSGPMRRAFYFMANGSSGSASANSHSDYLPGGMVGLGNDKAFRIWYRALSYYLTKSTTYLDARQASIQSAEDLYGERSTESDAVKNAFAAINVGKPASSDKTPPVVQPTVVFENGAYKLSPGATDNIGVVSIEVRLDGYMLYTGTEATTSMFLPPYAISKGNHILSVLAVDDAENKAVGSLTFEAKTPWVNLLRNPGFEIRP